MIRNLSKILLSGACALALSAPALAGSFTVLHTFEGNKDGMIPESVLTPDGQGNFYGTTYEGGKLGFGTVFRIGGDGRFSVVHAFKSGADGASPYAELTLGSDGALYGTTQYGGNMDDCYPNGCGTIFRIMPDGTKAVLYKFKGGADGASPYSGVTLDRKGNIYGATFRGGAGGGDGYGTVYKVAANGTETVLHAFQNDGHDGRQPLGKLALDKAGYLYGTTSVGGTTKGPCDPYGCGTVFKVAPDGTESLLYVFVGGNDAAGPHSDLIIDRGGNLYGTSVSGGTKGNGSVFRVSPSGEETLIHSFDGAGGGGGPGSSLAADAKGNLYGTTFYGGAADFGVVFRLAPDGTETVLYSLQSFSEGKASRSGMTRDGLGQLYGTASGGGSNQGPCGSDGCGTVFRLPQK